ncbi:MAG: amidohydrolase [Oscillospiraceae bacterium]|nr:amidohydrolase [Oscillospiraceae bacterium]
MKNPWILPTEFPGELIAIDMHSHINHDVPDDSKKRFGYSADIEDLIVINRAAGIEKLFCCTFASCLNTDVIVEENAYMHSLLDQYDCLYQWVVIDPRIEETFTQAERMLQHKKCVGIKLHPDYHKYSLEEYADKLFSFASHFQAVVLIHPEKDASYILPIADKYPEVTFIMAHLGGEAYVDAVEFAVHKNVYTDTSGIASSTNLMVESAYQRIGADRILFGTDTYSAAFQRGRIEFALIPKEAKQKILRDNALRLFAKNLL